MRREAIERDINEATERKHAEKRRGKRAQIERQIEALVAELDRYDKIHATIMDELVRWDGAYAVGVPSKGLLADDLTDRVMDVTEET